MLVGCTIFSAMLVMIDRLTDYESAASTIQTREGVGMTRFSVNPDADRRQANSSLVRSLAFPNMAIICASTK